MGCCISPAVAVSKEEKTAVQTFAPATGKAMIYIYRPFSLYSSALSKGVWINRQKAGTNGPGTFIAVPASPGTYQVQA
ncbi:MAG: DUF2846 domain-containing protein, partial [Proteobacteria bacterium]